MSIIKRLANIFKSSEKLVQNSINECNNIITAYIIQNNINRDDLANLIYNINTKDFKNEPNTYLLIKLFGNIYTLSESMHEDVIYDQYYTLLDLKFYISRYDTNTGHIFNIMYWMLYNYFVNYNTYSYTTWKTIYNKQLT